MVKRIQLTVIVAIIAVLSLTVSSVIIQTDEPVCAEGKIAGVDEYGDFHLDIDKTVFRDAGFTLYDTIDLTTGGRTYHGIITDNYALIPIGCAFIHYGDKGDDDITLGIEFIDIGWSIGDKISFKRTGHEDLTKEMPNLCSPMKTRDQCESDEEFANFREVTAGGIAPGRLYRSATPIDTGTNERSAAVDRLCQQYKADYLMCLNRSEKYVQDLYDSGKLDGTYYKTMYEEDRTSNQSLTTLIFTDPDFGTKLKEIIDNDASFDISCKLGQDRTGFLVMIIEALMGASYEEMRDDFMLSYCNAYNVKKGTDEYDTIAQGRFDRMFIGIHCIDDIRNPEEIDWDQKIDSFDLRSDAVNFVKKQYGMTDADIQSLTERLSAPYVPLPE